MRSLVAGAAGAAGRLFTDLLAAAGPVTAVDLTPAPGRFAADVTIADPELDRRLARVDVAVLALPAAALPAAVDRVAAALPPGALLAQVASVHAAPAARLAAAAARHRVEAVGLNPMFAPDLGFAGRPVAVVDVAPGPLAGAFERLLRDAGARPVRLTPARHDALTAGSQVATHAAVLAFGGTLAALELDAAELLAVATPPHRTLLALLARIAGGNPEVYREIQHDHPAAPATRAAMAAALGAIDTAGDPAAFTQVCTALRAWLGPALDPLAAHCAALFETGPPDTRPPDTGPPEPARTVAADPD